MNQNNLQAFVDLYEEFKLSDAFKERMAQKAIVPVFREIIREVLKYDKLTNQHLTDFIQLFKYNCTDGNFDNKLNALIKDVTVREKLSEQAYEIGETGFTNAGRTAISGLTPKQLSIVKQFLIDAFNVKTKEEAVALCRNYEKQEIPQVKKGIYSPWLFYINPVLFPIVNNSHDNFKKWLGLSKEYPSSIEEYHVLNEMISEPDFAELDFFAHHLTKDAKLNLHRIHYLNGSRLFKMSHGAFVKDPRFTKKAIIKVMEKNNWISLSRYTGKGGGDDFENKMKIGDIVYLCYGGDRVIYVGKIASDARPFDEEHATMLEDDEEEWLYREVEPLYFPVESNISALKTERYAIMPSGHSTIWEIKPSDLEYINDKLFIPYFNLKFIDEKEEEDDNPGEGHGNDNNQNNTVMSLNTILYGPPGTGKTFQLLQFIDKWGLIEENTQDLQYQSFLQDLTWWQVAALVLLELKTATVSQILEHELVKAKFSIASIQNKRARVWSTLQHHTVKTCDNVKYQNRHGVQLFYKEQNSVWRLDDAEQAKSELEEVIHQLDDIKSQKKTTAKRNYTFITCHQSLGYEDFIEGIKPVARKSEVLEEEERELSYEVKKGIFYIACEKAAQLAGYSSLEECLLDDKKGRERKFTDAINNEKRYVVFLDEINRCNVSSVFGELITLIEDDKRLGAKNEMADIILPYSQTYFGVPANLYIVGTMNTADRSVEALDTALRRRFAFKPKMPKEKELKSTTDGISLSKMLYTINARLRVLKDNDHTIGHAWLWDVTNTTQLKAVFGNKILPLLQEYFYNDYEKLGLVLGDAFFDKQEQISSDIFATFSGGNGLAGQYDQSWQYHLKSANQLETDDFKTLEVLTPEPADDEEE
jgi:Cdc6-like AAA superfamily ATPase